MVELKAFLSHRYKSPDVNLYFHQLFSEVAEVQFDVDVGGRFWHRWRLRWRGMTPSPRLSLNHSEKDMRLFILSASSFSRGGLPIH